MSGPVDARRSGDDGVTLVEVLVSAGVMSIVMVIFTSAVVQIYRTATHQEVRSTAQSQLDTAFLRLDREVRYAAQITAAGDGPAAGSDPTVEFLTTYTGVAVCTQLRLLAAPGGARLQRRTWRHEPGRALTAPLAGLTAFATLASELAVPGAAPSGVGQPFELLPATAGSNFERLRVQLTAAGTERNPRRSDVTFTALNSQIPPTRAEICREGRAVP